LSVECVLTCTPCLCAGTVKEQQRLIFAGQQLADGQTLRGAGVTQGCALQLALRCSSQETSSPVLDSASSGGATAPSCAGDTSNSKGTVGDTSDGEAISHGSAAAKKRPAECSSSSSSSSKEGSSSCAVGGVLALSTVAELQEHIAPGVAQLALFVVRCD
jgi:Ubiquitin family